MNHCSYFMALEDAQWVFIQGLARTSIPRVSLEVKPWEGWCSSEWWHFPGEHWVILTSCGHPTLESLGHFQCWKFNFNIKNMGYSSSCREFSSVKALRHWKWNLKGWKTLNYQGCSYMLLSVVKLLLIQECSRGCWRDEGITSLPNLQPFAAAESLWLPISELCSSQEWAEPVCEVGAVGNELCWAFPCSLCVCAMLEASVLLLGWLSQTLANLGWLLELLLGGRGGTQQGQQLLCQTLSCYPQREGRDGCTNPAGPCCTQECHCPLPSLRPQIQRHFPPWSKRWIHSGAAFPTRVHPPAPLGWHRML